MSNLAPLPQAQDFEQCTLGSILMDAPVFHQVAAKLKPKDFYKEAHRIIFNAMIEMDAAGIPIDTLTLYEHLKSKGNLLEDVGGSGYLTYLPELVPSPLNVAYYAGKVKETAYKRRLSTTCMRIDQKLKKGEITCIEASEILRSQTENILNSITGSLNFFTAKDLEGIEPVESLWGDIIYPECITQFNGSPGCGKTTFGYNLCIFGALGKEFLGVEYKKPIRAAYIDLETPNWKMKNKLDSICSEFKVPENLFFRRDFSLDSDLQGLIKFCKDKDIDLVVFDTQSRVFQQERENDNSEANRIMALLRQLANETGCALLLIHHTSKSDRKGAYGGRGASAIAGAVQIVINMESLDEEIIKLTVAKNNISGNLLTLYIRKIGEDRFEPYIHPNEGKSGFEIFRAQDIILKLSPEKIWETAEIYKKGEEAGFTEITTKRALGKLVDAGKMERIKRGQYRLNDSSGQRVNQSTPTPKPSDPTDPSQDDDEIPSYLQSWPRKKK